MKLAKARFLFVTTALAAGVAFAMSSAVTGCTVTTNETNHDSGAPSNGDSGPGPSTTDSGDQGDATKPSGACIGTTLDASVGPSCTDTEVDGGALAKCENACNTASSFFKPELAKEMSDCLDKKLGAKPTQIQCEEAAEACVQAAAGHACDDSAAAGYCTDLLKACPSADGGADAGAPPSQADCVTYARGMTESGRNDLKTCVVTEKNPCPDCFRALKTLAGD